MAPLPGRAESDGYLERANAAVVAIRRFDVRGGELEEPARGVVERDGGG